MVRVIPFFLHIGIVGVVAGDSFFCHIGILGMEGGNHFFIHIGIVGMEGGVHFFHIGIAGMGNSDKIQSSPAIKMPYLYSHHQ